MTRYIPRASAFLLLVLAVQTALSQQADTLNIDPRQYVSLIYKKGVSQNRFDTIWNWEKRKNVPNQKFYYLDQEGEINVIFNKTGLIENLNFEGTFSLEAEVSGPNGTRRIEVNPYSEIGVQRIPIGVKSEPPSEISKKLLNMLQELGGATENFNRIEQTIDHLRRRTKVQADLKRIAETEKLMAVAGVLLETLLQEGTELKRYLLEDYHYSYQSAIYTLDSARSVPDFRDKVARIKNFIIADYNRDQEDYLKAFKAALIYINQKTDIVLDYLNSFESAGEDAVKAFLSLINKDLISYNALKNGLVQRQNLLKAIDVPNLPGNEVLLDTVLSRNAAIIADVSEYLSDLSKFRGSQLEVIIKNYAKTANIQDTLSTLELRSGVDKESVFYKKILEEHLEEISSEVSVAAGRIIYKRLVYGTIDLGKSGANNGEVLNVYVTWILDSKTDSLNNSPRLPVGRYFIRKTGWEFDLADMFAMVKRIDEDDVNPAEVSPSNFKGSGGAVLMWTYNRLDKGLDIKPKGDDFTVRRRNKLVNFLEPSVGLNVSYLDFSTEKDVEIGVGLQAGLFRNKIFFGYGVNLHMLSPKNQAPTYFYLGFSFAKLSDLFKNSNNVSSAQ